MDENGWLDCTNPLPMLESLGDEATERKLRLFVCACWQHSTLVIRTRERLNRAVKVAERYADALVEREDILDAKSVTCHFLRILQLQFNRSPELRGREPMYPLLAALMTEEKDGKLRSELQRVMTRLELHSVGPGLLRDIFGNPFRPLPPRPEAGAPLAEKIYAGDWALIPYLGEWLQEHGYWSEGEHCLDPNVQHVKGCWVVDWVTGRE